ncbi:MAG: hypothetical protein FJ098_03975 [Deltaproteobacteria bacterium]|nr:hypothetical protein [Deltaproteobacteria bacterium]
MRLASFVTAALVMTLAAAAFAEDSPVRFEKGRASFEAAGFSVGAQRMDKDLARRDALRLETPARVQDMVTRFLQAHQDGEILAGGKIMGLAHVVNGDIWNVTVLHGDTVTVLSLTQGTDGAVVTVRRPLDNDAK